MNRNIVYLAPPDKFLSKFETAACFCETQDKILFLKRNANKIGGNTWGLPAGKLEMGETALDAVIRETREETGILLQKNAVQFLKTVYVRYPAFDFIYHMFRSKLTTFPENITLHFEEHHAYRFFTINQALNLNLILGAKECIKLIYNI